MQEELIKLPIDDKDFIALWKNSPEKDNQSKHILLTHGTFSSKNVMQRIVKYLVSNGFTCWTFEWRNHGTSSKSKKKFDFETIGQEDFRLVFKYLFGKCQIQSLNCITHSGGGICLTIALAEYPHLQDKISSISLFACQAFGAGHNRKNYIKIWLGKNISKLLGYTPAKKLGGEQSEPYSFMKQWFHWNLTRTFIGKSGVNYMHQMKNIKTPVLSVCGGGDTYIAPFEGCKMYFSQFQNAENKIIHCSKAQGFTEDFNHTRVIYSSNAVREIYPKVLSWIKQNEK